MTGAERDFCDLDAAHLFNKYCEIFGIDTDDYELEEMIEDGCLCTDDGKIKVFITTIRIMMVRHGYVPHCTLLQ